MEANPLKSLCRIRTMSLLSLFKTSTQKQAGVMWRHSIVFLCVEVIVGRVGPLHELYPREQADWPDLCCLVWWLQTIGA